MKTIICIDSVEKFYGNQQVMSPLSLDIREGEFLTILGPSGCGKTTLLRMIAGFETPSKGDITLEGKSLVDLPPYKRDMNMVFQQYALFPHMTVEKNICFGLKMKGINDKEQKERALKAMELTQLTEFKNRKPQQLSGGQQQRVAIARAIVNNPKVLLLDEPLGALDFKLRKDLQRELKNLQKSLGITFVYVTHDQEEAMSMSDRIAVMNKGNLEQLGTPQEIYNKPASLFVATFIGENNIFGLDHASVAVRPEKIQLHSESANVEGRLGTIEDIEFQGNLNKVFIKDNESGMAIIAYRPVVETNFKVGENVIVTWNKEDEVKLD
ncbi:MAG: ABC transporter ATP-binding protein [Bacillaceae bacterium]